MEDLRRSVLKNSNQDLVFQVIDIADRDSYIWEGGTKSRVYEVLLSGLCENSVPVTVRVRGFKPFFYVQVPEHDTTGSETLEILRKIRDVCFHTIVYGPDRTTHGDDRELSVEELMARIRTRAMTDEDLDDETRERLNEELGAIESSPSKSRSKAYSDIKNQLSGISWPPKLSRRKDLYWYKGENVSEQYYKLEFHTKACYYLWSKLLLDTNNYSTKIVMNDEKRASLKVYEANLEPTLRFIHSRNIQACGWVCIEEGGWNYDTKAYSDGFPSNEGDSEEVTVHHAICHDHRNLNPTDDRGISPVLIASFDIECDSTHGDFPLAQKEWDREVRVITENLEVPDEILCEQLRNSILGTSSELFGVISMKHATKLTREKVNSFITTSVIAKIKEAYKKKMPKTYGQKVLSGAFRPRSLGEQEGDRIIQIGTTFQQNGTIIYKHILTLGTCDPVPDTDTFAIDNPNPERGEKELIQEWIQLIKTTDPDIITGYNITFFDMAYIYDRCEELGITEDLLSPSLARYTRTRARYTKRTLSSAAMGDNFLKTIEMPGRVILDLCAAVRRNFASLNSYKLDSVAQTFLFGKIKHTHIEGDEVTFEVTDTFGLKKDGYLHACNADDEDIGGKLPIISIDEGANIVKVRGSDEDLMEAVKWTQAKDDVPPSEIFRLQKGSSTDRMIVAKYCVQDCDLVLDLLRKLDIVPNAMAMGSVCSVPLSYIFFRGQTIKLASLMYSECEKAGLIVPVKTSPTKQELNDSYEGAVVLEPKVGLYLEKPVAVLDYSSLYPSSMISENISHDSIVAIWDKDTEGNVVRIKGYPEIAETLREDQYVDITFDRYEPDPEDTRKHPEKLKVGTRTCRYVQFPDDRKGIVGMILRQLLSKRKETKKRMKKETNPFKKGLLNSLQLAYKVTANSLYGALGAKNSKIRFQDLAASTTAYGRKLLVYAREGLERAYGMGAREDCDAKYVYGDTDSVFVMFQPKNPDGTYMKGKQALVRTIELAKEAETFLTAALRPPHVLEYEKTFYPFMLFSKKRYIGMKYEEDPEHSKQTNMGVVLKRRDNAPIVKEIYQAVVDTILKERDLSKSVTIARKILLDLVKGKHSLKKLTITKSLRANYANPEQIAHKVLAERIGVRDPGNKPKSNDRIAFVYFDSQKTRDSKKQGDRIETPEYMVSHKLSPDYKHYITNQIQKPLTQLFRLFWTQVPEANVTEERLSLFRGECRQSVKRITKERRQVLEERMIDADIEKVVFSRAISRAYGKRSGSLDAFFGKK
jgi:DNA polymerase elongation subunit (family B)